MEGLLDYSILNSAQEAAMKDTEGAVLVLAGAGSGKTRVLTYRVAYLALEKNVPPYRILAITFTNKATEEMRVRLNSILGEGNGVWVSTFHSLCAYILKVDAERLEGYDKNFSIYDESDSMRLIKKALREKHLDSSAVKDIIKYHIGKAKNKGMSPDEYYADINGTVKYADEIHALYERYEELLRQANAMDFDDLLHKTKELFVTCPDVLEKYQEKWRYVHVDEFQDTNGVQFDLVKLLVQKHNNLFVVGDDDQSIYGWRGAEVGNILNFEKIFPGTKVHKLLENYRSTTAILDCANKVIANNKARYDKKLFTERGAGTRVEFYTAYNDYQEADYVIDTISALKRSYGYRNSDFAILVRQNSLTRLFENKLSSLRIRYQVMGGFRFFDRKEIQDVIAYMRVVSNMRDSEAIERIINFPRRGIGETTIDRMSEYSRASKVDFIDLILDCENYSSVIGNAMKKIQDFRVLISDLFNARHKALGDFVEFLVDRVGFENAYKATGKAEDEVRFENIEEFLRHIKEFSESKPDATLDAFLQTVSLIPEKEEIQDNDNVTIATMHAVKGLEFNVVFITACEENIFPGAQSINEGTIEEERRVMYVAITRARERLYLTNAKQRFRYNQQQYYLPSRFIAEAKGSKNEDAYAIREEKRAYIEGRGEYKNRYGRNDNSRYANGSKYNADFSYDDTDFSPRKNVMKNTVTPVKSEPPKVFNSDTSAFKSGDVVKHPLYGEGKILLVVGSGADATATVVFTKLGVKKFKLALAPLKLVK